MVDKNALLETINFLVLDAAAPKMYGILVDAIRHVGKLPIKLTDEAAVMNPLLALYREDAEAYEKVLALVDDKRKARGWPPLRSEVAFDRNEYQRMFMYQKRARERRVADIENMLRPERDRLIGTKRIEFIRSVSNKWKKRRDELLESERKQFGGTLSQDQMRGVLERFWETIDAELDRQEAEAQRKVRGW